MSSLEQSLAFRVHRLQRLLRRHFLREAKVAGFSLTPEQFFILDKLAREDGQRQADLADEDLQDRPNLTRMLREMEGRGWLDRRPDPEDGRSRLVHLTKEGRALHTAFLADVVHPARRHLFEGLPQDDLATAHRVFDHLESIV